MKPAPFAYEAPSTRQAAMELLHEHGWDAKVLAGGQSLLPLMNLRLARPALIVDINRVTDLPGIACDGAFLTMGALTRHQTVVQHALVQQHLPVLGETAARIGHLAIRMRGTVGGSMAHADPSAEWPLLAVTLGAIFLVESASGARSVPADAFFQEVFLTALGPEDLLTAVQWPLRPGLGAALAEMRLSATAFPAASAAAAVTVDRAGRVTEVRAALGAVVLKPVRVRSVEDQAVGVDGEASLRDAARALLDEVTFPPDPEQSVGYRRQLAVALMTEALVTAWKRAKAKDRQEGGGRD